MQVLNRVVRRVAVDMVNDLALLGASNAAMLPFAPPAVTPQSLPLEMLCGVAVGLFDSGVSRNRQPGLAGLSDHPVTPAHVKAVRQAIDLGLISEQRVAVLAIHLVVTPAHFFGDDRALAMLAGAADNLPAPAVIWGAMLFEALVVHQTKTVGGVFAVAAVYLTGSHTTENITCPLFCKHKALGNSWAVPCGAWILDRLSTRLKGAAA